MMLFWFLALAIAGLAFFILFVMHLLDERDRLNRETVTQETSKEKAAMDEWSARQW